MAARGRLTPVVLRVGLTGGLASGKSTVAARLAGLGIPVLDADRVVHDLYRPGGEGARAVAEEFGPAVLAADGSVDRARLAARAFPDPSAVARLNARVHPLVVAAQARWFEELARRGEPLGVVEATLLVESGGRGRYDVLVAVSAPEEVRLDRALARSPGATRDELRARLRAQLPESERNAACDVVIRNEGSREELLAEADRLAERLRDRAAAARR
ncbi:MAG: dephospho-CoA kinase [Acidobacteria bacterium]|nr:MAG: dephospho-CoA kinase [Acidobacteriota bacterium]